MKQQTLFLTLNFLLIGSTLVGNIFSPEEIKAFGLTHDMLPKISSSIPKKKLTITTRARPSRKPSRSKIKKVLEPKTKTTLVKPTRRIKLKDKKKLGQWIQFYTKKLNLYKRWAERASSEARHQRYLEKIERTKNIIDQLEQQRE